MTTLYLISSVVVLFSFSYFIFYRGWKKGLACGEKLVKQQVEVQIQRSKKLVTKTVKEVEEAMAQVKQIQNQIWDMGITKDKKKKAEKKSKIVSDFTMIQALYADLMNRQQALNSQASLQYSQLGNAQTLTFSQMMGQAAQRLYPPWPFNQ